MPKAVMLAMISTLLAACSPKWEPAFHERYPEEERGTVEIADPADALTFARYRSSGGPRVMLVTAWTGDQVEGVDVGALHGREPDDAVALFGAVGYDRLLPDIATAPAAARVKVPAEDLLLPVDFGSDHIAVGTNYPEHASDAGTTRPFLFPKLVQPTASGDPVGAGSGLLDYEVELAVVPLEPLAKNESPPVLGFILANDFTDRETLMHAVDRNDVESGKGFTTGKSFPGYLPVGQLFVVPRDWRAFAKNLELRLFVNGDLRQRAKVPEMVWDIDEVLRQVWARQGVRWEHRGEQVALFEGDAIPARTLVLTGTPHGTVFDGVPPQVIARGLVSFALGGWSRGIAGSVIEAYVASAREAKAYLQPGDEVLIHVQRLGQIRSRVVR